MLLEDSDKNEVIRLAKQVFSMPFEIWAYGSRVNGKAHDMSDLDLVIFIKNKADLDLQQLLDYRMALEASNIPIIVEVFAWHQLPKHFQQNILQKYVVLYSNVTHY